ncbi:MAG: DUF2846 domain-containing protein [Pyrinomonadaceae bacterium]
MRRLLTLPLLLLAFTVTAHAQADQTATVIVYRNFYHTTFGKAAPKITVNDEVLAVLDEGRYFVARVPVGLVVVKSGKKKDNRVDIDARAGETYYMRVRADPGNLFARFELFRVTEKEYREDAEKLRYVEAGDIKSPRVEKDAPKP